MLLDPGTVEGGVVPDNVAYAEDTPLLLHLGHQALDVRKSDLVAVAIEGGVNGVLVADGVRGVGRAKLLDRCEVDDVVTGLMADSQAILPGREGTEALGEYCLCGDAVQRKDVCL